MKRAIDQAVSSSTQNKRVRVARDCNAVLQSVKERPLMSEHAYSAILTAASSYLANIFAEQSDTGGVRSEMLMFMIDNALFSQDVDIPTPTHNLAFFKALELSCDHLKNSLNPMNCLGIMRFARRVFCYELEADVRRYLLRYFVSVATQSDEFLHLSLDELNSIIMEDELNVNNEEEVREGVLRWVNYDSVQRSRHTLKLINTVTRKHG